MEIGDANVVKKLHDRYKKGIYLYICRKVGSGQWAVGGWEFIPQMIIFL